MGKSVNELYELCDGLYAIKARAAVDKRVAARRKLKKKIVEGANDLLTSSNGLILETPSGSSAPVVEEELVEWKKIRRKAEELRAWALCNL